MKRIILAAIGALALGATAAQAQPYNLTLTGASPGGLWSRIGKGVDAALAAAYPGTTVTYQTSSGGLANIPMVAAGKVPMGMATDGDLKLAVSGGKPFKKPINNVRLLFRAYTPQARFQATHLLLNKTFADKYGIKSFADIVRKKAPLRVAINRRGNTDGDASEMVMKLMGAGIKDIESWGGQVVRAASREMTSLLLDRRIDMANVGLSYNHPRIREIAAGITPVLLDIPADVARKTADAFGGKVCTFEKDEYKFIDRDITSVCVGAVIVASADMDEQLAYNIAKGIVTQIEQFKTAHRLIKKNTTPQSLAQGSVAPFHPGALRYYREAGLVK